MTLLDTALAYATAGWPVFPLEAHGKQPLGKLAPHGLKDATLEEDIVRRWWKAEPLANIAIPTGIVFDVGDIDSEAALARFAELCGEHGVSPQSYPRARTGRGGRHIFFSPTGLGNKVDVIPGMDWRGKGGYVVVPESVHPSGTVYEWIKRPDDSLPLCPEWLLELLRPRLTVMSSPEPSEAPEGYVKAAVDSEMAILRAAPIGTRNDQLNRSAFALGQMVGAGWLSRDRAEAELRAAAHAIDHGHEPGLSATIESGLEAGRKEPRKPLESLSGGVIRQGTQGRGERVTEMTPRAAASPEIYSAASLKGVVIPQPRAVVPGVLQVGLNMLAGKAKLGKSWLALDIALAVSTGNKALASLPVEAGEVLYLALEDNKRRMQNRIELLGEESFPERLHIAHEWPKLDEGGIQFMEAWLEEHRLASLLIIDVWKGLRQKRARNANLYDEDYEHLAPLRAIANRFDVAILVVHHTRKAAAEDVFDEISGTGGVAAALDASIILHRTRSEADGEIWITGRDVEEAHLALKFEGGRWSMLGSATEVTKSRQRQSVRAVLAYPNAALTPSEIASALTWPANRVRQLLFQMVTSGEIRRLPNSKYGLKPLTQTLTPNTPNESNGMGEEGEALGVRAVRVARVREACPSCGSPAYSNRGAQRRCHKCGELYG